MCVTIMYLFIYFFPLYKLRTNHHCVCAALRSVYQHYTLFESKSSISYSIDNNATRDMWLKKLLESASVLDNYEEPNENEDDLRHFVF